jgi:hypothetical protein
MLRDAFKEWAVICKALAEGRQSLILRKGGIHEDGGTFRVEHTRFWLYPTHVHQQRDGIRPEAVTLLEESERERPPSGIVRLTHFAEVVGVYHVRDIASALVLGRFHLWSPQTVQQRFAYRSPGLFILPVRVHRAREVFELEETPTYAGCKSWVELDRELPDDGEPVLDEVAFREILRSLDELLRPTAKA